MGLLRLEKETEGVRVGESLGDRDIGEVGGSCHKGGSACHRGFVAGNAFHNGFMSKGGAVHVTGRFWHKGRSACHGRDKRDNACYRPGCHKEDNLVASGTLSVAFGPLYSSMMISYPQCFEASKRFAKLITQAVSSNPHDMMQVFLWQPTRFFQAYFVVSNPSTPLIQSRLLQPFAAFLDSPTDLVWICLRAHRRPH